MHKYLKDAMYLASTNAYDAEACFHLAAIVMRGGAVISTGFNKANTNGFVKHYSERIAPKGKYAHSTHAEMDAVLGARSKTDLTGCKIFVARRKLLDGSPGMARPCQICEQVLRSYGIKRAYYTIDESHYGVMNITGLTTTDKIVRI